MSAHYNTEPPPTASVLLNTTAGSIQISLFATQTPLASRNFLQHVLDGYYNSTSFHRVVPGFVIQGGDPTGTGEGGESIYEDREFEIDARTGEKVVFGDEVHGRLKLNRRGLVGMAKMGGSTYGGQFFITLADVRAQLDGNCTMFGRVEGDGIYNVVRIAEAENVEGTERPMYPFKIVSAEILEMPKGEPWASMKKRDRVAKRTIPEDDGSKVTKKVKTKKKGKVLLSFGGDEGDDETGPVIQPKAKYNTALIETTADNNGVATNGEKSNASATKGRSTRKQSGKDPENSHENEAHTEVRKSIHRRSSSTPPASPPARQISTAQPQSNHRRKPSFHEPTIQLPIRDPESPSRSPTGSPKPTPKPSASTSLHAEIAALKASMRRTIPTSQEDTRKLSALEQLIPPTAIRGRKRPRHGDNNSSSSNNDSSALKILNAFKARLEGANRTESITGTASSGKQNGIQPKDGTRASDKHMDNDPEGGGTDDEEAALCDLHFIIHCQSCSKWDEPPPRDLLERSPTNQDLAGGDAEDDEKDWMTHALSFEKDRLGKDLTWKRKNEEELVVIDPREKEREITGRGATGTKGRGGGRGIGSGKEREWGGRGR